VRHHSLWLLLFGGIKTRGLSLPPVPPQPELTQES
jgi:hypothetical protein